MMLRHTYFKPKYILKCVRTSQFFGSSVIQKYFFYHFFTLHTNGKWCNQEGFNPCYSQSQVVYAYHVLSLLLQGFVWSKCHFLPFFGRDIKTEVGVVIYIYLKYFPDHIDFKYRWVHGSNSQGSSVFDEISFLAFLAFYTGKGEVARWDPHVTPGVKSYICIPSFRSVASRVFLAKYHIWLFLLPW